MLIKQEKRIRRHNRVRAKIIGTSEAPRLCVFRSHQHIYAQIVNDQKNQTIVAAKDIEVKPDAKKSGPKAEKQNENILAAKTRLAFAVGKLIAEKALAKKISQVVFDRAGYQYHGRVKALAEGAREGGLQF
jgi:large subunit ribosomal protein L18